MTMFGGLLYIMQEIKVKNVIIGKQYESCANYKKFAEIVKEKSIKVNVVEAGQKINIEKNLFFDVFWPCSDNMISENAINNNSLVCKLKYKNFSMLFTGDIEEIAEKAILSKYSKNENVLKAEVLKVAHHGSKTSSTIDFLNAVNPNCAVIGVGKNNNFGHPSDITIQNLKKLGVDVYRTDEIGEIEIKCVTKNKILKK